MNKSSNPIWTEENYLSQFWKDTYILAIYLFINSSVLNCPYVPEKKKGCGKRSSRGSSLCEKAVCHMMETQDRRRQVSGSSCEGRTGSAVGLDFIPKRSMECRGGQGGNGNHWSVYLVREWHDQTAEIILLVGKTIKSVVTTWAWNMPLGLGLF